jgi:hypothetical protein
MTSVKRPPEADSASPTDVAVHRSQAPPGQSMLTRWLPFASAVASAVVILLITGTSVLDIIRYAAYAGFAVVLPGTLVYRSLRRTPHTFVEDVAMGVAIGLALELAAWAAFSVAHLQAWLVLWPATVIVPFAAVPRLRRHWRVRGYTPTPLGWSWSVAGVVVFWTSYLWSVFLARNPILPTSEGTRQYLDLAYQLSLAGEAKHHFPPNLPQVAGEPLYYHWFGYAHMATTSLIGHIDLAAVSLRFAVPALCAAAIVLTAVVGWRVSGRPYVGVVASVLFWVIGEFNFTHPVTMPFGTQASFVIWHGMSMTYSWVLIIALVALLADVVGRAAGSTVRPIGSGVYLLSALLLFASSGAKASSLPVVLGALAVTAVLMLVVRRRIAWPVVAVGALAAAAQAFATAVLFHFQTYGLAFSPLANLRGYWAATQVRPEWKQWAVEVAVFAAFVVNMQLRTAGILPLAWLQRGRLEPVGWLLLGGGLAGVGLFLMLNNVSAQYFDRAGFPFAVLLSAWGYVLVFDRARLSRRGKLALGAATLAFAAALVVIQVRFAGDQPWLTYYSPLVPIWKWGAILAGVGLLGALGWPSAARLWPALRGRGAVVGLTFVLVAGAPGLIMDEYKSWQTPNGGAYANITLPRSRVDAARWVRDHSRPNDVVATNVHCLNDASPTDGNCDARVFSLSAYAERSMLVEGWSFAPRMMIAANQTFWDPQRLRLNDEAFTAPTTELLTELRRRYDVRWLLVDRTVALESDALATLARRRFDNGRLAVYELR